MAKISDPSSYLAEKLFYSVTDLIDNSLWMDISVKAKITPLRVKKSLVLYAHSNLIVYRGILSQ